MTRDIICLNYCSFNISANSKLVRRMSLRTIESNTWRIFIYYTELYKFLFQPKSNFFFIGAKVLT